jgi:adenosine deaminase
MITSIPSSTRLAQNPPHIELHVHLRGAMPIDCLHKLCQHNSPRMVSERIPPAVMEKIGEFPELSRFLSLTQVSEVDIQKLLEFGSLPQFLYSFFATSFFFRTVADFKLLVDSVLARFKEQGIIHSEVTVSLGEYLRQGLPLEDLLQVLNDARADSPQSIQWILDPVRNRGAKECVELLQSVLDTQANPFVGITLGGAEDSFPIADFVPLYRLADKAGLRKTIHCGESGPPSDINFAVEELQVERIGHGVRAVESSATIDLLLARGVHLEVCPTANLRCGLYSSIEQHPLKQLLRYGLSLSLNTDDPTFFQNSLNGEFELLPALGLSQSVADELKISAVQAAFVPDTTRIELLNSLNYLA